jgi:hypothetical protein
VSSEPIEVLQKRLMAISRGHESARGFHFFCQVGSAQGQQGVTTLQMSGTGWTLVGYRSRQPDKPDDRLYSVYLSARDLRAFARALLKHPFWELDNSRQDRRPHETNIHLRVADTSKAFAWSMQLWSGERERQLHLRELLKILNIIIETTGESQVLPI